MQAYLEIDFFKKNHQDFFNKRDDLFRRECRNYITKLHKFISHYMMQAQVDINDSVDNDFFRWTQQKEELKSLKDTENFNELFIRRKEMQITKKQMKNYLRDLTDHQYQPSIGESALYDTVKQSVCKRVQVMLQDLGKIISFAFNDSNLSKFDDLLEVSKIEEIQLQMAQSKYLLSIERLKEKLAKLKENLNYVLKEIDSVGLASEYNSILDENLNPDLKNKCKISNSKCGS